MGVSTVARTLVKVWNESARIVDPENFLQHTWNEWAQLKPDRDEPVIQTQWLQLKVPEVQDAAKAAQLSHNTYTKHLRDQ